MKANVLTNFIKDSIQELHKVTWPTKNQAVRLSMIVLGFTLASALFIGVLDYLFSSANGYLINNYK